jgi:hypothetical protein
MIFLIDNIYCVSENAPVGPNNKPKVEITISQCGQM